MLYCKLGSGPGQASPHYNVCRGSAGALESFREQGQQFVVMRQQSADSALTSRQHPRLGRPAPS